MKTFLITAITLFALTASLKSIAQDQSEKAYIIRRTGVNGSAVNFKIYIDDILVCKVKNKHYTIQDIKPGEHKIHVMSGGLPYNRKPLPVKFTVSAGKSNYFVINNGNELICTEVTEASANPLIAKSIQVSDCKVNE